MSFAIHLSLIIVPLGVILPQLPTISLNKLQVNVNFRARVFVACTHNGQPSVNYTGLYTSEQNLALWSHLTVKSRCKPLCLKLEAYYAQIFF